MEFDATIAKDITLKARDYEGKDDIYELIQSAARQGLSHVTVYVNKSAIYKFMDDMKNKGFMYKAIGYERKDPCLLYHKTENCIVFDVGWISEEWIKDNHE